MIEATLNSHLRVPLSSTPAHIVAQIQGALTIANPEKQTAIREMLYNADLMPDTIPLYRVEGDDLVLPRGFYASFLQGVQAHRVGVKWRDDRRYYDFMPLTGSDGALSPIELRDYQRPAVNALVQYEQGTLEMATGAGKTVCVLEAARQVDQPALIIVDRSSLADQWVQQIQDKLGCEAGYLGEDRFDVRPITVALRQAMWARLDELDRPIWDLLGLVEGRFFDLWGTVVTDECHHSSTSGTLQELLSMFPARYRWGVSATPDRDPAWAPVARAVIGPILHRSTYEDVGESLVTPTVRVLESSFEFDYRPTTMAEKKDEFGEPVISGYTGKPVRQVTRNNYGDMLAALCADSDRNEMIAQEIVGEMRGGHKCVVVSKRKEHLKAILSSIEAQDSEAAASCVMLVGGTSGKQASEVRERVSEASYITVLSTIADEALDMPSLDRVFLVYPARNPETVKQIVGRIMRPAPGKTDAVIVDVWDRKVRLLMSQSRERSQMLFGKNGWPVQIVERV